MVVRHGHWREGFYWLLWYIFFWYLLTGGAGFGFALPVLLLAAFLAYQLKLKPLYLRVWRLPGFAVFFVVAMWRGAWDVARRALHPARPLRPAWVDHPLRTRDPRVQQFCSALVGLLPGTLVAYVTDNQLRMHLLDQRQPVADTLGELERRLEMLLTQEP